MAKTKSREVGRMLGRIQAARDEFASAFTRDLSEIGTFARNVILDQAVRLGPNDPENRAYNPIERNANNLACAVMQNWHIIKKAPELLRIAREMHIENMERENLERKGTLDQQATLRAHLKEEPNCEYCRIIDAARAAS